MQCLLYARRLSRRNEKQLECKGKIMAKVFKRGKYYYFRLSVNGRDTWKSTGQTSRDEAQAIADAYADAHKDKGAVEDFFQALMQKITAVNSSAKDLRPTTTFWGTPVGRFSGPIQPTLENQSWPSERLMPVAAKRRFR